MANQSEIANLVVTITADLKAYLRGMTMAQQEAAETARRVKRQIDSIDGSLKFLGTSLKGIAGTLATAFSIREIKRLVDDTSDAVEQIDNLSRSTGLTVQQLQGFKGLTAEMGLSFENVVRASAMFQQRLYQIERESGGAAAAVEALGIAVKGTDGQLRPMSALFPEIITKLQGVENETTRNMLAAQLFGKGWQEIAPILGMNSEEMDGVMDRLRQVGVIMSDKAINAARDYDAAMDRLNSTLQGIKNTIAVELMPAITDLATSGMLETFGEIAGKVLGGVIKLAVTFYRGLEVIALGLRAIYEEGLGIVRMSGKLLKGDLPGAAQQYALGRARAQDIIDTINGKYDSPLKLPGGKPGSGFGLIPDLSRMETSGGRGANAARADAERQAREHARKLAEIAELTEEHLYNIRYRHADRVKQLEMERNREMAQYPGPESKKLRQAIWADYADQINTYLRQEQIKKWKEDKATFDRIMKELMDMAIKQEERETQIIQRAEEERKRIREEGLEYARELNLRYIGLTEGETAEAIARINAEMQDELQKAAYYWGNLEDPNRILAETVARGSAAQKIAKLLEGNGANAPRISWSSGIIDSGQLQEQAIFSRLKAQMGGIMPNDPERQQVDLLEQIRRLLETQTRQAQQQASFALAR